MFSCLSMARLSTSPVSSSPYSSQKALQSCRVRHGCCRRIHSVRHCSDETTINTYLTIEAFPNFLITPTFRAAVHKEIYERLTIMGQIVLLERRACGAEARYWYLSIRRWRMACRFVRSGLIYFSRSGAGYGSFSSCDVYFLAHIFDYVLVPI